MITIKFDTILMRYNNNKHISTIPLKEEVTVQDILNIYKIIPGEAGVILLNSSLASEGDIVRDKDIIEIFPIC